MNKEQARIELDEIISKYFEKEKAPMILETTSSPENKIIHFDNKFFKSLPLLVQKRVTKLIKIINL